MNWSKEKTWTFQVLQPTLQQGLVLLENLQFLDSLQSPHLETDHQALICKVTNLHQIETESLLEDDD